MPISSCNVDLPNYVKKQFLKVNDTYTIPSSNYSLQIISIDCNNSPYTVTIRIDKINGSSITSTFDLWSGNNSFHSYDNNSLCIDLGWQDCQTTPNSVDLDIWYMSLADIYLDLHVKPNSWYTPQSAFTALSSQLVALNGAIANIVSTVSGYRYVGTQILPPDTDGTVIIRIGIQQLVPASQSIQPEIAPALITLAELIIGAITTASIYIIIGVIAYYVIVYAIDKIATILQGKDILQNSKNIMDNGKKQCETNYPNRASNATDQVNYNLCLKSLVMSVGKTTSDYFKDNSYQQNSQNTSDKLDTINTGLQNGSITPQDGINQSDAAFNQLDGYYQQKINDMSQNLFYLAVAAVVLIGGYIVLTNLPKDNSSKVMYLKEYKE